MIKSGNISISSKLSCMSLLPASMNRIRSRTAEKKLQHRFPHYKSMRIFPALKGSLLRWLDLAKFRTPLSSNAFHCYLQVWKGMDEKQPRKSGDTVSPIITLSVTTETSGRIWLNFESSKLSCMLSLPASMKRIRSRTAEKSGDIFFPIISLWGFFQRFKGR